MDPSGSSALQPPFIQPPFVRTPLHRTTASEPNAYGGSILFHGPITTSPEAIEEPTPATAGFSYDRYRRPTLGGLSSPRSAATLGNIGGKEIPGPNGPQRSNTAYSGWGTDPSGLSHIDIPQRFGAVGEYWKYYDELSDRHDKEMIRILSDNLDILLIFVSPSHSRDHRIVLT